MAARIFMMIMNSDSPIVAQSFMQPSKENCDSDRYIVRLSRSPPQTLALNRLKLH